ncbi:MAG TPA: hypothetical protein VD947_00220 [Patescibacteria group bacterium]|nr:hypothetical protein [Patescibacteria group bacterium]
MLGFAYKLPKLYIRPLAVVKEPFCPVGMDQDELLTVVGTEIQAATTEAFTLAER